MAYEKIAQNIKEIIRIDNIEITVEGGSIHIKFRNSADAAKFNDEVYNNYHLADSFNAKEKLKINDENHSIQLTTTQFIYLLRRLKLFHPQSKAPLPVHPLHQKEVDISVLNEIAQYILSSPKFNEKTRMDALKVVNCLMFVKANMSLLLYAVNHKEDEALFSLRGDNVNKVIRDFANTAVHFGTYQNTAQCERQVSSMIAEFENGFSVCKKQASAEEFVQKLKFDGDVGCLEARVLAALHYAGRVASTPIPEFSKLMESAHELPPSYYHKIRNEEYRLLMYRYFISHGLFGKPCNYVRKEDKIMDTALKIIDKALIDDYLTNILFLDDEEVPLSDFFLVKPEDTLARIKQEQVLAKTLSSPYGNNVSWDFFGKQLADPANERPVNPNAPQDRTIIYNPRTGVYEKRKVNVQRGGAKPGHEFTKKTATTLLSVGARIRLYNRSINKKSSIGLLFDIDKCKVNEKYIFLSNAYTNYRWWVGMDQEPRAEAVSLSAVRDYNHRYTDNGEVVPEHNEIMACLSKEALLGVFTPDDILSSRLNAIFRRDYLINRVFGNIPDELSLIPIFIITGETDPREYTLDEQAKDILQALLHKSDALSKNITYTLIKKALPKLIKTQSAQYLSELLIALVGNKMGDEAILLLNEKPELANVPASHEGYTALHYALNLSTPQALQLIEKLSTRELSCLEDKDHKTALELAIGKKPDLLEALINGSVQYMTKTQASRSLNYLMQENEFAMVDLFLSKNVPYDKNFKNSSGQTLLHYLVSCQKLEMVKKLCENQPDANSAISNHRDRTALDIAIEKNNNEIIECLLQNTNQYFTAEQIGGPLLKLMEKNPELAELLLRKRPDASKKWVDHKTGNTAAHYAVLNGREKAVELLCCSAPIIKLDVENRQGKTILDLALESKQMNIVQLLVEKYSATLTPKQAGRALLVLVHIRHYDLAKTLLNQYPTLEKNHCTSQGETALHLILKDEVPDSQLVNLLCSANNCANTFCKDKNNRTALDIAMTKNDSDSLAVMINSAWQTWSETQLGRLLVFLIDKGNYRLAEVLLEKKPNIDTTLCNQQGNTALHLAVIKKQQKIITLMCNQKHSADSSLENKAGQTALDLALSYEMFDCANIILAHSLHKMTEAQLGRALPRLAQKNRFDLVEKVLVQRKNIPMHYQHYDGNTVLHHAVIHKQTAIINSICQHHNLASLWLTPNNKQETPFQLALRGGSLSTAKTLLDSATAQFKRNKLRSFFGGIGLTTLLVGTGIALTATGIFAPLGVGILGCVLIGLCATGAGIALTGALSGPILYQNARKVSYGTSEYGKELQKLGQNQDYQPAPEEDTPPSAEVVDLVAGLDAQKGNIKEEVEALGNAVATSDDRRSLRLEATTAGTPIEIPRSKSSRL